MLSICVASAKIHLLMFVCVAMVFLLCGMTARGPSTDPGFRLSNPKVEDTILSRGMCMARALRIAFIHSVPAV